MNFSDIMIRLGADFTGKKAFQDASKATIGLEKSVAKLGKQFTTVFSAYKIAQFGKDSVKAFANDQKQVVQLTAAVKSLGLAFAAPEVNKYIDNLERLSGINRDILQPAFQKLLTQTGSISKSQKILNAAIAVSKSGVLSLEDASNALTQAYVGNTKGIKQFNLGLTNAEISAMTFDELLKKVSATYKDQFAASLDTVQTKLDKLSNAVGNFKEAIGKGLVDTFANLVGGGNIDKATASIENLGNAIGNTMSTVTSSGWVKFLDWLNPANVGNFSSDKKANLTGAGDYYTIKARAALQAKAEKEAALKAKQIADTIKKQNADLAKQLKIKQDAIKLDELSKKYKQAEAIFNLDQIEVAAAMQNKQTNEDMARLKLKQDLAKLQDAINAGDVAAATAIASLVDADLKRVQAYQAISAQLATQQSTADKIKAAIDAMSPKQLFDIKNIDDALDRVATLITKLTAAKVIWSSAMSTAADEFPKNVGGSSTSSTSGGTGSIAAAIDAAYSTSKYTPNSQLAKNADARLQAALGQTGQDIATSIVQSVTDSAAAAIDTAYQTNKTATGGYQSDFGDLGFINLPSTNSAPVVNVQVTDNAAKMVDVVMDITQNQSANGNPTRVTRIASNLAW